MNINNIIVNSEKKTTLYYAYYIIGYIFYQFKAYILYSNLKKIEMHIQKLKHMSNSASAQVNKNNLFHFLIPVSGLRNKASIYHFSKYKEIKCLRNLRCISSKTIFFCKTHNPMIPQIKVNFFYSLLIRIMSHYVIKNLSTVVNVDSSTFTFSM